MLCLPPTTKLYICTGASLPSAPARAHVCRHQLQRASAGATCSGGVPYFCCLSALLSAGFSPATMSNGQRQPRTYLSCVWGIPHVFACSFLVDTLPCSHLTSCICSLLAYSLGVGKWTRRCRGLTEGDSPRTCAASSLCTKYKAERSACPASVFAVPAPCPHPMAPGMWQVYDQEHGSIHAQPPRLPGPGHLRPNDQSHPEVRSAGRMKVPSRCRHPTDPL